MADDPLREPTSPVELLACVARADDEVTIEEALAIRAFMSYAGVSQQIARRVERLLDTRQAADVEAVVRSLAPRASPWVLAETLRDAYVIASVDGTVEASDRNLGGLRAALALGAAPPQAQATHGPSQSGGSISPSLS